MRAAPDPDRATGTCVVLVAADGERDMFVDPGASAALAYDDLPDPAGFAWLHLSGYPLLHPGSRAAAAGLIRAAAAAGVRTSVDPASAAPLRDLGADRFAELIGGVQLLLPNADEAAVLTGVADPAAAAESLLSIAETVVVTLGDLGALHADRSGASHRVPSVQPPGPVLDSTGAGDAFAAGWIAAHLRGDGAPQCLAAGARAGAVAVTLPGGRPPDAPPVGFSRSAG